MQVHAKFDPLLESLLRLVRFIDIASLTTLHPPLRVIHFSIDDSVPDGLGDDVLGVLFRIKVQFETDVFERDSGVGERDHSKGGLDDVVSKTDDQRVRPVRSEFRGVRGEHGLESFEITDSNGYERVRERSRKRSVPRRLTKHQLWVDLRSHSP